MKIFKPSAKEGSLNNQLTICARMLKILYLGGRSSVGRASVCGTECRQFNPGRSPH